MSHASDRAAADRAADLAGFFYAEPAAFGEVTAVSARDLPPAARRLLDHESHMTVAMERFHGGPVGLEVIQRREDAAGRYAREILLTRPAGGGASAEVDGADRPARSVQYGIVRIALGRLAPPVAAAIRDESIPLGRILLAAGLLTDVHDVALLRILPGSRLQACLGSPPPAAGATFGRVAEIGLDGVPAIELLEILAPGSWRDGAA